MKQEAKNLRINGDRLWDSIMEMAKIGPGIAGGNNRQTLTDDDAKGRELFKKWCESCLYSKKLSDVWYHEWYRFNCRERNIVMTIIDGPSIHPLRGNKPKQLNIYWHR